jgi:hypothetical protein
MLPEKGAFFVLSMTNFIQNPICVVIKKEPN